MSLVVGRVIGDVVDQFTPSVTMEVAYNTHYTVSSGHELMPNIITSKPHVHIGGVDMRSSYTIVIHFVTSYVYGFYTYLDLLTVLIYLCICFYFKILTDPDAPSPSDPYLREHLHW